MRAFSPSLGTKYPPSCITTLASGDGKRLVPVGGKHDAIEQLAVLSKATETAPKSFRWKARAKVGERVRWYEVPEETAHH